MPRVRYKGKIVKLPYTRKGYKKAKALRKKSRNSRNIFTTGDDTHSAFDCYEPHIRSSMWG